MWCASFSAGATTDCAFTLAEEPELLGSAGTIAANRAWVESDPCFWVFYADVLTNMDLPKMLAFHRRSGEAATLGLYRVSNPSQCGIAEVDAYNRILSFIEKPKEPMGDLAFSGVMIGTPELLKAIPPTVPADLGFHVFPRLSGRMAGYVSDEYLKDVGTLASYEAAQRNMARLTSWSRRMLKTADFRHGRRHREQPPRAPGGVVRVLRFARALAYRAGTPVRLRRPQARGDSALLSRR